MAKRHTRRKDVRLLGGVFGAAEGAPLSQGRDGAWPLPFDGEDLTEPPDRDHVEHGEPTEPVIHAPTATEIEGRPVATGECTVESVEGEPLCDELEPEHR